MLDGSPHLHQLCSSVSLGVRSLGAAAGGWMSCPEEVCVEGTEGRDGIFGPMQHHFIARVTICVFFIWVLPVLLEVHKLTRVFKEPTFVFCNFLH